MRKLILALLATLLVSVAVRADTDKKESPKPTQDLSQIKTADDLWKHIDELKAGRAEQPASEEEARKSYGEMFRKLLAATDDFIKRFPDDGRKWDVKMLRAAVIDGQANLEGREADVASRDALLKEIVEAKDAPAKTKTA